MWVCQLTLNSANFRCTECPQVGVLVQHSSWFGGKGPGNPAELIVALGSNCTFMIPGISGQLSFTSISRFAKPFFFLHLIETVVQSSDNTRESMAGPGGWMVLLKLQHFVLASSFAHLYFLGAGSVQVYFRHPFIKTFPFLIHFGFDF